jgi:acyl-CoA synthetase (AMP-forming)/AMP-acid ligase II
MFDAAAVVDAVVDEKCTVLHGVPTHFLSILTEVEKREQAGKKLDFSSLRYHPSTIYPSPCLTRYLQNRYGGGLSSANRTDEEGHRQT